MLDQVAGTEVRSVSLRFVPKVSSERKRTLTTQYDLGFLG